MTTRVLQANGLVGERVERLFAGASPITHVIYIIKENRTYDQVFGDIAAAGDGTPADGDASLALFGAGEAARRAGGPPQDITPNHHALALRFGLFDRFFVNSEASPDGHNWSTAAFSTDYVDKAFRWDYSGRGRSYDYEGFNRAPDLDGREPPSGLSVPASAEQLAAFMRRFVPYLNGWRDAAEPDSLYLWDAAARAGCRYRTFGEFVRHDLGRRRDGVQPPETEDVPGCVAHRRDRARQAGARGTSQSAVPRVRSLDAGRHDGGELRSGPPVEHADGSAGHDRSRRCPLSRHVAARRLARGVPRPRRRPRCRPR